MKIVFFGTSEFAADILALIFKKCDIVSVVTQPDSKKGRSLKLLPPPVKIKAEGLGLAVLQPLDINDVSFTVKVKKMQADAFVVVSFGGMLGKELLYIPKFGALNIHPSLLPKYRGAAPIQRALLSGDKKTGLTIIKMDERLDAGDIILQKELDIEEVDNEETLSAKLASMGADLLVKALKLLEQGKAEFRKQNENEATMAPKLRKEEGLINWDSPTLKILNKIRALKRWPGSYSFLNGRMLKIISAKAAKEADFGRFSSAEVILADQKNGFIVRTKDGAISILEAQIEGKKKMSAELFLRGHKIKIGARLGN
jgi:methionyl-tRNA formyltransferase